MPHIWVEHSANLEGQVDFPALLSAIHDAAIDTKAFGVGAIRTRLTPVRQYRVADAHPDNTFVHVIVRIAAGRDLETKKRIGEAIFAELTNALDRLYQQTPLGLSLEVQELDADLSFRKNNLQSYVDDRSAISTQRVGTSRAASC